MSLLYSKLVMPDADKKRTSACEKLMKIVTKVLTFQVVGVGNYLLHEAATQCNFPQVEHLMMHGANPDQKNNNNNTPLDLADEKKKELHFTSCCTDKSNFAKTVRLKHACCEVKYHLLGLDRHECKLMPVMAELDCWKCE